jgi:acetylornithine deacetylase/succinyl-diaminopimelate desuccinylase-like protein
MTLQVEENVGLADLEKEVGAVVKRLKKSRPRFDATVKAEGNRLIVTTRGQAVHSSVAPDGHNALWDLAAVASQLKLEPYGGQSLLRVVAKYFDGDHWGRKLGISHADPLMGKLLVVPTMLKTTGPVSLSINMRRPQGKTADEFKALLETAGQRIAKETSGWVTASSDLYVGEPHVADTSGPLVNTLLDIYRKHFPGKGKKCASGCAAGTGEKISVRGGTYGRLFPGAVDFGPSLPGEKYAGHAPAEKISVRTLEVTTQMLAEAVYRLAFQKKASSHPGPLKEGEGADGR